MYNSQCTMIDIEKAIAALDWKRDPYGLYEPIEYTLASGGKRLRPRLVLLAAEMFGGKEKEVLPAALAIEVFHNFTLLHDDVMDNAAVRRGRPTVHVRWNDNTAILSGDQMVIEAYKLLGNVPADRLPQTLRLFNKMATEICEGQQYDMDFERMRTVPMADYMKMIGLKTSVLIACAAKMGAIIAEAPRKDCDCLYDYGYNLGLAFQVADDYLDAYGDVKVFGKPIGGDILNEKKSWLTVRAFEKADAVLREELMEAMSARAESEEEKAAKISRVKAIYDTLKVGEDAKKAIVELTDRALTCVSEICKGESFEILRDFADRLVGRTK